MFDLLFFPENKINNTPTTAANRQTQKETGEREREKNQQKDFITQTIKLNTANELKNKSVNRQETKNSKYN